MKTNKLIIALFCIFFLSNFIIAQRGVGNRKVTKLPSKEKRWALIIGVSKYQDGNITTLPGANNDAKALTKALVDYSGFDKRQIITLTTDETPDRRPTKNNILKFLGNLKGLVPKDGMLLVAFSGHGIERNNRAFLLASDTPYNDNLKILERTAVSVTNDFKELIRDTGVKQVLVLLDACRNDPSGGRSNTDNPLTEAYKKGFSFDTRNKKVEAFATIYATSIGERAYEYTRENKGYFTWAFIEGLKGGAANSKGEVTLGGLIHFIERKVPKQVRIDLGNNKIQKPFSIIEGYSADSLVIAIKDNSKRSLFAQKYLGIAINLTSSISSGVQITLKSINNKWQIEGVFDSINLFGRFNMYGKKNVCKDTKQKLCLLFKGNLILGDDNSSYSSGTTAPFTFEIILENTEKQGKVCKNCFLKGTYKIEEFNNMEKQTGKVEAYKNENK